MKRRCIDGLTHVQTGFAWMGRFETLCTGPDPRFTGMALYERLPEDAPVTCLQCVSLSSPVASPAAGASQRLSGGQK